MIQIDESFFLSLDAMSNWFKAQGSVLEWITAIGTLSASALAAYFGVVRPNSQRAKFKIHNPTKAVSYSTHAYEFVVSRGEGDIVEVGFLVEQISGTPAKNVQILVKKVLFWERDENGRETGKKNMWPHFLPSNLVWAAKESTFAKGVQRFCRLGIYGDPPSNPFVGPVFDLSTTENNGDPLFDAFSSMLPNFRKYEIELMISGENVKEEEFQIELELVDIRALGPIGDDGLPVGGKQIEAVEAKVKSQTA